jgi:hypothetical protein
LFDVSVAAARDVGLLAHCNLEKSRLGCIDSTGMEAGHVSHYFTRRTKRKQRTFPKILTVIHAASHVCLEMATGKGPSPDDRQFHDVAADAHAREPFKMLASHDRPLRVSLAISV